MTGITKKAREIAKERQCPLYRVQISRNHLIPKGSEIDISGALSNERADELLALITRWLDENRTQQNL